MPTRSRRQARRLRFVSLASIVMLAAIVASCADTADKPASPPPSATPGPPPPQTPPATPPATTPSPSRSSQPAPPLPQQPTKSTLPPAELKIDSQLRAEINRAQGKAAPPDRTGVRIDSQQRALVDVRADPTAELQKAVEATGATIVSVSARDRSIVAWVPLLKIDSVAVDAGVRAIVPAAEAMLQSQIVLGREFDLRAGQTLTIGAEPLRLHFERVVEDSRCPTNVTCIWAGDAVVRVLASTGGDARGTLDLHTKDAPDKDLPFSAYRIRLIKLTPVRRDTASIPADQYVVTLLVTKAPQP